MSILNFGRCSCLYSLVYQCVVATRFGAAFVGGVHGFLCRIGTARLASANVCLLGCGGEACAEEAPGIVSAAWVESVHRKATVEYVAEPRRRQALFPAQVAGGVQIPRGQLVVQ